MKESPERSPRGYWAWVISSRGWAYLGGVAFRVRTAIRHGQRRSQAGRHCTTCMASRASPRKASPVAVPGVLTMRHGRARRRRENGVVRKLDSPSDGGCPPSPVRGSGDGAGIPSRRERDVVQIACVPGRLPSHAIGPPGGPATGPEAPGSQLLFFRHLGPTRTHVPAPGPLNRQPLAQSFLPPSHIHNGGLPSDEGTKLLPFPVIRTAQEGRLPETLPSFYRLIRIA